MAPRGILLGVIPSLVLHFPRRCCKPGGQRFPLRAQQAWAPLQTHQHQPQCPPVPGETLRRPGARKRWQGHCSAALSPVPSATPPVTVVLGCSCWVCLSAQPQQKEAAFDSRAMPGSREIRNKPKPSGKRGLRLCASHKELDSLGRLSSWLITTGQIFN